MATIHKDALRKLLNKGNLTGFEVAKITLADCWEDEHARDSILSENEQRLIIDHLTNPDEIRICNDWIGAFDTICEVNSTAHIVCLMTRTNLSSLATILKRYLTAATVDLQMRRVPAILTEKQLEDLRVEHRRSALRKKHSLEWVLFMRADELLRQKDDSLESLLEEGSEKAVHAYRQACGEIRQLIESNRLGFRYRKKVLTLLKRIETSKSDREIFAIIDQTLFANPKCRMEEPEPFLEKATTSGEALYEAELPEWLERVDEYRHDNLGGIAIIQNPSKSDLDGRGHYRDDSSFLKNYPFQPPGDGFWKVIGLSPQTFFTKRMEEARFEISDFLFFRMIMKLLSEKTGIGFCDDVDRWYRSLESAVKSYEVALDSAVTISPRARKDFAGIPPTISIDELQPSSDLETLIRNRLDKPLMKSRWLEDCKKYYLQERLFGATREELEEMLSGMGKEARKRIYGILEENGPSGTGLLQLV